MAFQNYGDLKEAVRLYMHRNDLDDAKMAIFTKLAETRMQDDIKVPELGGFVELDFSQDTGPEGYLPIPDDFNKARQMNVAQYSLEYKTPQLFFNGWRQATGDPVYYTFLNQNVWIGPKAETKVFFDYWTKIPPLTTDLATNEILLNYPSLYFAATLGEAHHYVMDFEKAQLTAQQYRNEVDRAMAVGMAATVGNSSAMETI